MRALLQRHGVLPRIPKRRPFSSINMATKINTQIRLPSKRHYHSPTTSPTSIPKIEPKLKRNTDIHSSLPPMAEPFLSLNTTKPNDLNISCTVFNERGDIVAVSKPFQKWQFLKAHHLYPRDLRKIDSSPVDVVPDIIVKPECIVVNLLHVKALIERDKVYVFDTTDQESAARLGVLMYDLESKLAGSLNTVSSQPQSQTQPQSQPYEHNALESIFINVMSSLETEYRAHETVCNEILLDLENQISRSKLRDLLIKSKDLTLFYQKSLLIREVLDELLENDEDMAGLYLTSPREPDPVTEELDVTDIEMLLETYYTQCDEFVQHAESLIRDIKSTEEIVNIILDANRNSLMLLELKVTIYTLGITVASLLPAFYGMNLKNFIEESNLGFAGVLLMSGSMGYLITKRGFRALNSATRVAMSSDFRSLSTKSAIGSGSKETRSGLVSSGRIPQVGKNTPNMMTGRRLSGFKCLTIPGIKGKWSTFKRRFKCLLFGRQGSCKGSATDRQNLTWTKEEKDAVWRWLTKDDKWL